MTATGAEVAARSSNGRWPANVIHDGSIEVLTAFPEVGDAHPPSNEGSIRKNQIFGKDERPRTFHPGYGKPRKGNGVTNFAMTSGFPHDDSGPGSAARFFYQAKADKDDRLGFTHPTIKPVDLMQWLVRLVTPKGGWVLDPFSGTGTTGEACWREKRKTVLIERDPAYQDMLRKRVKVMLDGRYARTVAKQARTKPVPGDLFK